MHRGIAFDRRDGRYRGRVWFLADGQQRGKHGNAQKEHTGQHDGLEAVAATVAIVILFRDLLRGLLSPFSLSPPLEQVVRCCLLFTCHCCE